MILYAESFTLKFYRDDFTLNPHNFDMRTTTLCKIIHILVFYQVMLYKSEKKNNLKWNTRISKCLKLSLPHYFMLKIWKLHRFINHTRP